MLSLLLELCCLVIPYAGVVYVHDLAVRWCKGAAHREGVNLRGPLPDVIHNSVALSPPVIKALFFVPDYWLIGWAAVTALPLALSPAGLLLPALNWFVRVHAPILALRALCVFSTLIPTSVPAPLVRDLNSSGNWYVKTISSTANDMVFSGHSVLFVLLARTWTLFINPGGGALFVGLAWACALGGATSLAVVRQHYTIDVVLGVAIAILADRAA